MIARARIQESIVEGLALHPRVALLGLRQCGKTTLARPVALGAGARIFDLENPDYVAALGNPIKPSIPRLLFPLSTFRFFFRPPSGIENDSTTQPINTVQMQCHRKNLKPRLKACFEAEHRSFGFDIGMIVFGSWCGFFLRRGRCRFLMWGVEMGF